MIIAHANVRKRMEKGQFMEAFNMEVPPAPAIALPVVTFTENVTVHFNSDTPGSRPSCSRPYGR